MTTLTARPRPLSAELAATLPGAALVLLMSGAVIYALSISNWASGLDVLLPMALPALALGVLFARMPWLPGWLAHPLSAALALVWCVQLLGGQMDDRLSSWRDQATELLIRAIIWSRVLASGGRGEDILLFVAALCLLCWLLAYASAWMVFRSGWVWRAVVINAVVALVNYTYVLPKPTLAFFVFLGAALLLVVYQHVLERQRAWAAQRIEYPDLLPLRFLWSSALVCGALILITAALPGEVSVDRATSTWDALSRPFRAAREGWEDMFSTINAPPGAGSGAFTSRGAQLGGARQLDDEPVMYVRSTEYEYWRAVAFDKYEGGGWQNTTGEQARAALGASTPEQARTPLGADVDLALFDVAGRVDIPQVIELASDRNDDLITVGGVARSVSLPTLVEHNYGAGPDGGLAPNYDDTALLVAREPLRAGTTYTVTALVSKADVASLRAAGDDYPAWVRERYLQLPEDLTQRTRERAAQIVADAGARSPYDQAIAIQDYLRTLPYNERISAPPAGQEPVDWFLFEQREGYCDYFASAMVLMLRSNGVPARWVRGYAGGEFDVERGVYVVRENVAHSWPEVYFPGFGWQRFEPTPAAYTVLPQRPLTSVFGEEPEVETGPLAPGPGSDPADFEDLDEGIAPAPVPANLPDAAALDPGMSRALGILGAALGGLGLLAAAIYGRWRYELRGLSQAGRAFAGMELLAAWGGLGQPAHSTPHEYAERLAVALPEHRATIRQVAAAYQTERYRRRRIDPPEPERLRELYLALLRRVVTGLGARLPQPRAR